MVMMIYSPKYVSTGGRLHIYVCYVCNGYICIPSQTAGLIWWQPYLCSVNNPFPAMSPWIILAPNQWETTFYSNDVSHWLSACTKWSLCHPDIFRENWIELVAMILLSVYSHYSDVIMSGMASQTSASRLFARLFVLAQIKENIKAPPHWSLWGESTGGRWIPLINDQ